jgi:hypothetical protein
MNKEKTLTEMLYVGPIYIDVGADMDVPAAKTEGAVFGTVDLGGEIGVTHYGRIFGDEPLEGDPVPSSVEGWIALLIDMRDMLARCFVLGKMIPTHGFLCDHLDEEENANLDQAIRELGEEFFEITLDRAIEAIERREEKDERFRGGLKMISDLMKREGVRRGLNKEEREKMTLGDMLEDLDTEEDES